MDRTLETPESSHTRSSRSRLGPERVRNAVRTERTALAVHEALRSPGEPLHPRDRRFMERRLGHDFGQVRVHADARANETAEAVGALAYTVGRHIVFGASRYAPETSAGRRLLAHELAHVAQQAGGARGDAASARSLECDAAAQADRALGSGPPHQGALRPLPSATRPLLQRYPVPGELRCDEVVDWLGTNSPYSPEWAQTSCNYSFNGGLRTNSQTLPDGRVEVTVSGHKGLTVSVSCPIDRPQWNPTQRPNRAAEVAAWNNMRASLDAHEEQHRQIGQQWRGTLESRFRAVSFTVTGSDQADAMAQVRSRIASDQQQWGADAQAAQSAIDPFTGAVLTCP